MSEQKFAKSLPGLVPDTGIQLEDERAVSRQLSVQSIAKASKNRLIAEY